ncbi:molybdenum import ATP-binding protein ModC [Aliidongia dinghuensis]|uniref:Molybdenum import ATP-binding protein ModC n=1 Tax=Aliidongia dinghuensis TaxID=1867774 RepID=A0A8J3E7X5_9PROT|nr:molybdenum ABC transporter ATP-binding protein [Aliidongia dinghuensis]GGF51645.1 molybdenum import ATP-binding protein ModC [Aliidongia dinghuensis]
MSLVVDVALARPGFTLEVAFDSPGSVTALFGRSGAGKSTIAALLAGLVRPDKGRIALDGEALVDRAARVFVPPHRRRIGYVFQDGRLFPHLSVRHNLLYGAWFQGRRASNMPLADIVELLGIGHLLDRRPATLSGGEKQRVAIGRALLMAPRLLVLDEPLASLDQARKDEILPYLERLRDETRLPMVYVSHSREEVVRLADQLVMIEAGRVTAAGPIGEVMSRFDPAAGTEPGAVLATRVSAIDASHELATLDFPGGRLTVPAGRLALGQAVRVQLRARDVAIATAPPTGLSILNTLPATIVDMTAVGPTAVGLRLDCGGTILVAEITRLSAETLALAPGKPVHALIKSVSFDRPMEG